MDPTPENPLTPDVPDNSNQESPLRSEDFLQQRGNLEELSSQELDNARQLLRNANRIVDKIEGSSEGRNPEVQQALGELQTELQQLQQRISRNEELSDEVANTLTRLSAELYTVEERQRVLLSEERFSAARELFANVDEWNALTGEFKELFAGLDDVYAAAKGAPLSSPQVQLATRMRQAVDLYRQYYTYNGQPLSPARIQGRLPEDGVYRVAMLMRVRETLRDGLAELQTLPPVEREPAPEPVRPPETPAEPPKLAVNPKEFPTLPNEDTPQPAPSEKLASDDVPTIEPERKPLPSVQESILNPEPEDAEGMTRLERQYFAAASAMLEPAPNRDELLATFNTGIESRIDQVFVPEPWAPMVEAFTTFKDVLLPDEARLGGSPEWRAFRDEAEQSLTQIWMDSTRRGSRDTSRNYPMDLRIWRVQRGAPWRARFKEPTQAHYGIARLQDMMQRYLEVRDRISPTPPYEPKPLPELPAGADITKLETLGLPEVDIDQLPKAVQERFAAIDEAYATVYAKVVEEGNAALTTLAVRNWLQARQNFSAYKPSETAAPSGLLGMFSQGAEMLSSAGNFTSLKPDMDPYALRTSMYEMAAKSSENPPLSAEELEAALRIKLAMPDILGPDGRFATDYIIKDIGNRDDILRAVEAERAGEFANGSVDIPIKYGPILDKRKQRLSASLKMLEQITNADVEVVPTGGFNETVFAWMLEANNAPEEVKGIPAGSSIDVLQNLERVREEQLATEPGPDEATPKAVDRPSTEEPEVTLGEPSEFPPAVQPSPLSARGSTRGEPGAPEVTLGETGDFPEQQPSLPGMEDEKPENQPGVVRMPNGQFLQVPEGVDMRSIFGAVLPLVAPGSSQEQPSVEPTEPQVVPKRQSSEPVPVASETTPETVPADMEAVRVLSSRILEIPADQDIDLYYVLQDRMNKSPIRLPKETSQPIIDLFVLKAYRRGDTWRVVVSPLFDGAVRIVKGDAKVDVPMGRKTALAAAPTERQSEPVEKAVETTQETPWLPEAEQMFADLSALFQRDAFRISSRSNDREYRAFRSAHIELTAKYKQLITAEPIDNDEVAVVLEAWREAHDTYNTYLQGQENPAAALAEEGKEVEPELPPAEEEETAPEQAAEPEPAEKSIEPEQPTEKSAEPAEKPAEQQPAKEVAEKPRVGMRTLSSMAEYQEMLASGRPFILRFTATWCPKCRTASIKKIDQQVGQSAELVVVDFDSFPEIMQQMGVNGVPRYTSFVDGKPRSTIVGKPSSASSVLNLLPPKQRPVAQR